MTATAASPIIALRQPLSLPMPDLNPQNLPPVSEPPEPSQIRQGRERLQLMTGLGITAAQRLAASIVETEHRRWQEWEAGKYRMHPGLWKLFVLELARAKPERKKPGRSPGSDA